VIAPSNTASFDSVLLVLDALSSLHGGRQSGNRFADTLPTRRFSRSLRFELNACDFFGAARGIRTPDRPANPEKGANMSSNHAELLAEQTRRFEVTASVGALIAAAQRLSAAGLDLVHVRDWAQRTAIAYGIATYVQPTDWQRMFAPGSRETETA
jgi:hypothetical protein